MSFKEKLDEIYENLGERIKTPFVFTFISVWTFRHWELMYSLFNFDKDYILIKKIEFIKDQIKSESIWELLVFPIFFTFLSIGLYYILQLVTEIIVLTYKKWVRPWLYSWMDTNKLATKSEVEAEKKVQKRLQTKIKEQEDTIRDYVNNENDLKSRITNNSQTIRGLEKSLKEQRELNKENEHSYKVKEEQVSEKQKQIDELNKIITKTSQDLITTQRLDGEVSTDLTEIFSPGEVWTFVKGSSKLKTTFTKFYLDKEGHFFLFENKPIFSIENVRIRKVKNFVEFDRCEIGTPKKYVNRLIIINENILVGHESGIQSFYIKGEYSASDTEKSNDFPLFLDYRNLFTK